MAVDDEPNPDAGPGSASAAAHREAAAAVKTPEFLAAASAAHGVPARGTPDPEQDDETQTADPEGPSPSSAPTSDDADEPELSDDYNPEEVETGEEALEGEDRTKATDAITTRPSTTGDDDVERTWAQYKTEDERKKALAANKKYGIEQANRAKALQAEIDSLKAGQTTEAARAPVAEPEPTDPAEGVRKTLAHLYDTDPGVKAEITKLGGLRTQLLDRKKEIDTLKAEADTHEKSLTELQYRLKFLQESATSDPDNFELSQKVGKTENEISRVETIINSKHTKLARLEIEQDRRTDEYVRSRDAINDFASKEHVRSSEEARSRADYTVKQAAAVTEWETTFPAVMDELKITEAVLGKERSQKLRERINKRLLITARSLFANNPATQIDVKAWMKSEAAEIAEEYNLVRDAGARKYVEMKKADATVQAPVGAAAVAAVRPETKRFSARDADRQAAEQMRSVRLRS